MKKNIKSALPCFLLMLLWVAIAQFSGLAQSNNGHIGVLVGATGGMGFNGPTYGVSGGGDFRKDKFAFSGDVDVFRIDKTDGGKGYQVRARETVRYGDRWFVQGGAVQSYYSNVKYTKSSFEPLIGFGRVKDNLVLQVNYRHDLTSENRVRTVEGIASLYTKNHFYVRGGLTVSHFRFAGQTGSGLGGQVTVGAWF